MNVDQNRRKFYPDSLNWPRQPITAIIAVPRLHLIFPCKKLGMVTDSKLKANLKIKDLYSCFNMWFCCLLSSCTSGSIVPSIKLGWPSRYKIAKRSPEIFSVFTHSRATWIRRFINLQPLLCCDSYCTNGVVLSLSILCPQGSEHSYAKEPHNDPDTHIC